MSLKFLDFLETYEKEDVSKVKKIMGEHKQKLDAIIKESFNCGLYTNKDEAILKVTTEFANKKKCPKDIDHEFVTENLKTIVDSIKKLDEASIKVIFNTYEAGTGSSCGGCDKQQLVSPPVLPSVTVTSDDGDVEMEAKTPKKGRGRPKKTPAEEKATDTAIKVAQANAENIKQEFTTTQEDGWEAKEEPTPEVPEIAECKKVKKDKEDKKAKEKKEESTEVSSLDKIVEDEEPSEEQGQDSDDSLKFSDFDKYITDLESEEDDDDESKEEEEEGEIEVGDTVKFEEKETYKVKEINDDKVTIVDEDGEEAEIDLDKIELVSKAEKEEEEEGQESEGRGENSEEEPEEGESEEKEATEEAEEK